jgi:hypothetical protein
MSEENDAYKNMTVDEAFQQYDNVVDGIGGIGSCLYALRRDLAALQERVERLEKYKHAHLSQEDIDVLKATKGHPWMAPEKPTCSHCGGEGVTGSGKKNPDGSWTWINVACPECSKPPPDPKRVEAIKGLVKHLRKVEASHYRTEYTCDCGTCEAVRKALPYLKAEVGE